MYSIKNFKAIKGHDGQGFTATLYVDDKRSALLFDDGWGGGYQWTAAATDIAVLQVEHDMEIWCKKNKGKNAECYIGQMIDELELRKEFKKTMKKMAIAHEGSLWTFKQEYNPKYIPQLQKTYPGCIVLNALSEEDALAKFIEVAVE